MGFLVFLPRIWSKASTNCGWSSRAASPSGRARCPTWRRMRGSWAPRWRGSPGPSPRRSGTRAGPSGSATSRHSVSGSSSTLWVRQANETGLNPCVRGVDELKATCLWHLICGSVSQVGPSVCSEKQIRCPTDWPAVCLWKSGAEDLTAFYTCFQSLLPKDLKLWIQLCQENW